MSLRIELYDGGDALYIALDPDGIWAKSEFPDELITLDYNPHGKLIGIEAIGSAAREGAAALLEHVARVDPAVRERLDPVIA